MFWLSFRQYNFFRVFLFKMDFENVFGVVFTLVFFRYRLATEKSFFRQARDQLN